MPRLFGFARQPLPGPRALPLVGKPWRLYRFLDDPVGAVLALHRQGGELAAVVRDDPALVAVFGPAAVRAVLSEPARFQHDEAVFTGPPGSRLDLLRNAIIAVNGEVHGRHRRLMQPAFGRAAMAGYAEETAAVAEACLASWPVGGAPVRVDALTRELALCVAVRCFYGMDVVGGATELGHLAAELVEILTDPFTILAPFNLPGMPYRRAVRVADALLGRLAELVERKRSAGPPPADAFADALSRLIHTTEADGTRLSEAELLAEATTLFVAGHETIAMTLAWTIFLLEQHPDVLEATLDELAPAGDVPQPTGPWDASRAPTLDRVIKESMRVMPSVPTLFLRVCGAGATVGGVELPAGANLLVSPLAAHRDPAIYPEPDRFLPDRWVGFTPPAFSYLPFGAGPRTCVGAAFAQQALRILLPMILRRFRFEVPDGAHVSRLTRANILLFKRGLTMRVLPFDRVQRAPGRVVGDVHSLVPA